MANLGQEIARRTREIILGALARIDMMEMRAAIRNLNDVTVNSGVYIIEATGSGRHKIGWSEDISRRLKDLQTGCPFPIRIIGVLKAGQEIESALHRIYAPYRVSGEWFELPPAAVYFLSAPETTGEKQDAQIRHAV